MNPNTRIDKISLINFKNHSNTNLKNLGTFVVLNGNNGSGKTNILEAISLFSPGRGIKNSRFIEIPNKNLIIKKNSFAARFNNYDLIFEVNEFEGRSPLMSMSKYDYKNNKFLDDYFCDVKTSNIN